MKSGDIAQYRSVLKSTGTYIAFAVLNRLVPFLLLPILTIYLSPADYGVLSLFSLVTLFLMPVVGLNANVIVMQSYFKNSVAQRQELLATCYVLMTSMMVIIFLLWMIVGKYIAEVIRFDQTLLLMATVVSYAGMVLTMTTTLYQIRDEGYKYGMIQFVQMLSNVGLSLLFVVLLKQGLEGRLLAIVLSALFMMTYSFYLSYRQSDFSLKMLLKPKDMPITIKTGVILTLSSVAAATASMGDRFILAPMVSMDMLGVYSIALMFCQVLDVLFSPIAMTFLPIYMRMINSSHRGERSKAIWVSYGLLVTFFLIAYVFSLLAPYLIHAMLNEKFHSATNFIVLLAMASAATAASAMFNNYILAQNSNIALLSISIVTLISTIGLNYILIAKYGTIGAAKAVFLTALITLGLNMLVSSMLSAKCELSNGEVADVN